MKHKIKQLIAEYLIRRGELKIRLKNLSTMTNRSEELQNTVLDELLEVDRKIQELEAIYKSL